MSKLAYKLQVFKIFKKGKKSLNTKIPRKARTTNTSHLQTHCARQGHPPNSDNSVNPLDECSMCCTTNETTQAPNKRPSTTAINAVKWLGA